VTTVTVGDLEINLSGKRKVVRSTSADSCGPNETVITFTDLDRYAQAIEVEKGVLARTASLDDVIRMKRLPIG
jgi:hypothetical protein